MHCVTDTSVNS